MYLVSLSSSETVRCHTEVLVVGSDHNDHLIAGLQENVESLSISAGQLREAGCCKNFFKVHDTEILN